MRTPQSYLNRSAMICLPGTPKWSRLCSTLFIIAGGPHTKYVQHCRQASPFRSGRASPDRAGLSSQDSCSTRCNATPPASTVDFPSAGDASRQTGVYDVPVFRNPLEIRAMTAPVCA
jgi:hypothetical protein